jgi:hypothetical protein
MCSFWLSIVTYYLFFFIEPKFSTSMPLVVVLSFASGLVSQTVLGVIIHKADEIRKQIKAGKNNNDTFGVSRTSNDLKL